MPRGVVGGVHHSVCISVFIQDGVHNVLERKIKTTKRRVWLLLSVVEKAKTRKAEKTTRRGTAALNNTELGFLFFGLSCFLLFLLFSL